MKFEDAIQQLESIIDQVESGQIGLEQALDQYEAGMGLIKHCKGILNKAEAKIAKLTEDPSGKLAVEGESTSAEIEEEHEDYE
ncbi:Exodeoxyribonuclease 7 small subunit [Poriferisphaera corsica]|uniref:Exodeoxyribonuclease 7 small subunit n=2 Tax=Poriferisphaera corsica TaxID=2528020 RepID=A0A517YV19_9BACT|nr:Exodeoxyribonuclease 7 small subunit [Poriferisphaera corsica]